MLLVGDRLPPQRELANRLKIDFTTVARGYVEARKRGLVDTQVGRGTFVIGGVDESGAVLRLMLPPIHAATPQSTFP